MPAEDLLLRMRVEGGRVVAQEVGQAEHSVDKYERTTKRAHHSTEGLTGALHGLRSAAGFALSVGGLAGIGFGLAEAVRKAEEFQNVTAQLRASLKANVKAPVDAATESMIRFSEHLSVHGGFAPPEEIQGLTQLVRVTHNVKKAQDDLTLATNVAHGKHLDLATAVRAVSMVEGGRLGTLTRLGIILPKHATAMQALAVLQKDYAGATDAYNRSAEGAFSNLTNTLDILGEKIGKLLIPYIQKAVDWLSNFVDQFIQGKGAGGQFKDVLEHVWKDGLQPAAKFAGSMVGHVKDLIKGFKDGQPWAVALVTALAGLAGAAGTIWAISRGTRAWAAAQGLLDLALDANPFGITLAALAGITAAIVVLSKKYPHLWENMKRGLQGVVNWIIRRLNDVISAYNDTVGQIFGKINPIGQIGQGTGIPLNAGHGTITQFAPVGPPRVYKPGTRFAPVDTPHGLKYVPLPSHITVHTQVNLDGQQVGRGLSRVGRQAMALH